SFFKLIFYRLIFLLAFGGLFFFCSCSFKNADPPYIGTELYPWEKLVELSKSEQSLEFSIDTFFKNKVKHAGFNGSVLVADHGKIIYQNSFGYSQYESKKPLTDSSQFQLASASKPFTATAVLILRDKGEINLDDLVSKYLEGFPYDSITVRMLLTHRSGLGNYVYLFDSMKIPADSFITNQQVLDYFIQNKPSLQAAPGHHFQYCNTNYALLALIIEKVSGESYAQFLNENIFLPCHMHYTFVSDARSNHLFPNETLDYRGTHWSRVPPVPYDGVVGDKGIYSTPFDLYLFDQALDHGLLLKKETLDEAYKGYSYEKPGIRNYGLGWRLKEFPNGEKLIYHNGWWRGYNSVFDRRPDRGICVAVLTNKYNRNAYNLNGLFDLLHITDGETDEDEGQ
ncbi:MAG: serine hydrolase domain-containing protein, partial [Chitinophagales bacterium]